MSLIKKLFTVLEPVLANGADSVFQVLKEEGIKSAGAKYGLTENETMDYLKEVETARRKRDRIENSVNTQLTRKRSVTPKATATVKPTRTTTTKSRTVKKPTATKPKEKVPSFEELFGVPDLTLDGDDTHSVDFLDLDEV